MLTVVKRDGRREEQSRDKVRSAMVKAGVPYMDTEILSLFVRDMFHGTSEIFVEDVQDAIETVLMTHGYPVEAKAFIIYRNNHHKARVPKCKQHSESFAPEYLWCDEYADKQGIDWEWTHLENDPTSDVSNLLAHATPSEIHAITYTSCAITHYEGKLGESYWAGRFQRIFSRHEFRNVGLVFARMESQVHAKVYRKFNDILGLEVPGFYESYKHSPALAARMKFIDDLVGSDDDLLSLAMFSLLEGVSLFCIFAFYKHFQRNGKKLLPKFVSNINFSARDEILHSQFGAQCYRTLRDESFLSEVDRKELEGRIIEGVYALLEHERLLIDEAIPKDDIQGITVNGLKGFVYARAVKGLTEGLGIQIPDGISHWTYLDDISESFYNGVDRFIYNDNFAKGGREYTRKFSPDDFDQDWSTENE